MIWPMMAIGNLINLRSQGTASLKRIDKLLNEPYEIADPEDAVSFEIKGEIEFGISLSPTLTGKGLWRAFPLKSKPGKVWESSEELVAVRQRLRMCFSASTTLKKKKCSSTASI